MISRKKKILITVKTYPLPSKSYEELVCTVGVTEDGEFIRLYPIDFRYRPYHQWYKKYQWIEVELEKNEQDNRKESCRPKLESIRLLEEVSTVDNWAMRKKYVLARGALSMEQLWELQEKDKTSLGVVKPACIEDLIVEPSDPTWKPSFESALKQGNFFGPDKKPLEKIPFKFSYKFRCNDARCNGHTMEITDWELGELYRRMRDKYQDPDEAAKKVKQRFFDTMCGPDKDTHFFVGTVKQFGTWIVLGVFWPKK
jgi:hypothetical protein